jgi:serine protease AprX
MRLILFLLLFLPLSSMSQNQAYWVFLSDKNGVSFDPMSYFDEHAISKRQRLGIPLDQHSDRPVRSDYLSSLAQLADSVAYASRWLNAVALQCSPEALETIKAMPYVVEVFPIASAMHLAGEYDTVVSETLRSRMRKQINAMDREAFSSRGYDGAGVRIAIFDAGFTGADSAPAFRHIYERAGVIKTWDFKKKTEDVYHGHTHGTMVWSCIAGKFGRMQSGLATGAEFLLARTEGRGEPFAEEVNWIAALEWADQNGADIINSSLGYTFNRYFPEQMDGRTAPISRAAAMAAGKGILVVNAAGNEGSGRWYGIGAPADADSIISVGGIDPSTGYHTSFSSYGPSSDGRIKPNVSAYGHVGAASKSKWTFTQGTSFSSPLVAGYAACTRQAFPDTAVMDLITLIEKSASLYPYYDYAHGYGVPQASRLFGEWEDDELQMQFKIVRKRDSTLTLSFLEEKFSPDYPGNKLMYCHIRSAQGRVTRFFVVEPSSVNEFSIDLRELKEGDLIAFYYRGVYKEFRP